MEVHFPPELEARLDQLATDSGRAKEELVLDAMSGYLDELERVRRMLDRRYDAAKTGGVELIDGEEAFARLRAKSQAWRKNRG
jgi:hypothetical protein